MNKSFRYLILLIMAAFLIGMCLPQGVNGEVISQIDGKKIIKAEPISLDAIKLDSKLMPDTLVTDDNKASVETIERKIEIDKFEAENNDKITLKLVSDDAVDTICFKFPVHSRYIEIKNIKLNVPFWFDKDIKEFESKEGNNICYKGLNVYLEDIYFEAEYRPTEGMPLTIKYDIDADGLILDPYLIGTLATSNQLILRLPFDNNSSNVWSSKISSGLTTAIRFFNKAATAAMDYSYPDCTSEGLAYDGDYSTSTSITDTGTYSYCGIEYIFYRNSTDTGMNWEVKDQNGLRNMTISDSCFNYNTAQVKVRARYRGLYTGSSGESYLECYNGGYITLDYQAIGTLSNVLYDTKAYITNQSGYTAYTYPTVNTQYVNANGLTWGSFFSLYGNDTTGLKNWVNVSQVGVARNVTYSSEGAIFNGQNSTITLP